MKKLKIHNRSNAERKRHRYRTVTRTDTRNELIKSKDGFACFV